MQATIERWARAYTARDARGVDEVQPGTEAVMEKAFRDLRRVSITLSGCRIAVQGTSASAACTEQHLAETKFGGAPTSGTGAASSPWTSPRAPGASRPRTSCADTPRGDASDGSPVTSRFPDPVQPC